MIVYVVLVKDLENGVCLSILFICSLIWKCLNGVYEWINEWVE